MITTIQNLKAGDKIVGAPSDLIVKGVDGGGFLTIVDFTDGTATAPVNGARRVEVIRKGA